jgi:Tfp pilus assembly protein PilO
MSWPSFLNQFITWQVAWNKFEYVPFIVSTIFSVLVAAIVYITDINFLYKKLAMTQKQITVIKKEIGITQQKQKLPRSLSIEHQVVRGVHMIPELELVSVLDDLGKEMAASQVAARVLEPLPIQQNENFIIYPIKLELDGGYKSLFMFINRVLRLPYLVVVEDLDLQKNKDEGLEDLNLQTMLMIYKNKYIMDKNAKSVELSFAKRDIFKPEIGRTNIYLWSSKELRFFGLIKQAGLVFGVIGDPLGGIYRVGVGDKIGLNRSVIVGISECGITTTKQTDAIYSGEKCVSKDFYY